MTKHIVLITLVVILLGSCGTKEKSTEYSVHDELSTEVQITQKEENVEIADQRKLIREGEIIFETDDLNKTRSIIIEATTKMNGYITNDHSFDYGNKLEHRVIIRVPSSNFDELLDNILEGVHEVDSKTIRVLDVTEEYIDVQARLNTKKELETRFRELLKEAGSVEEILAIEKEIGALREEIESVEGRLRYLQDRVSFSTLTVTYYQKVSSAFSFGPKVSDGFKNGWKGFLWFIIGLVNLWPLILLVTIGLAIIIRYSKRKRDKNAT
jgi:hypothetical protein